MVAARPRLEVLDRGALPAFTTPSKRIHEAADVPAFLTSLAYRDIGVFIMQLNHAVCPRRRPGNAAAPPQTFALPIQGSAPPSASVAALQELLAGIERLVEEAPPAPGPRRFGNLSFRAWHALLAQRVDGMLGRSYLLGAFGSAQRLDYGTGHELSFVAFLGCLWKLSHFHQTERPVAEVEREIVFSVIEPQVVAAQPHAPPHYVHQTDQGQIFEARSKAHHRIHAGTGGLARRMGPRRPLLCAVHFRLCAADAAHRRQRPHAARGFRQGCAQDWRHHQGTSCRG
ncbi:phosphotyrosyl phosphatase activator [Cordyceps fumosorosea ARSEF 2679]|uniref:Serine/threonine-protein phosphatase 2A activator n=1 Tax=Cordyceps fumosorosea (strain ARSEF 2679) TaxID=1081104 RepID=A0A167NWN9_CORFA|nr:phosphotyrosyl phosphatase activator [Cordyceps fumosorosea ARSEF 2679]OAA56026.1 phosphotyrosyl phosphatase activator [Cordyceps fumosorosea ARSEF 2679]